MPSPSSLCARAASDLPPDSEKQTGPGKTVHSDDAAQSEKEDSGEDSSDECRTEPGPDLLDTETQGVVGAVGRVLSRISTQSTLNPEPPPDGGKAAWIACKWFRGGEAREGRDARG